MRAEKFRRDYPDLFFLDEDDTPGLAGYLRGIGVLDEEENVVRATRAGDGNMNRTARVWTDRRSLIVKQSRPWVERYPDIAAPWDRVIGESRFYVLASPHGRVAARMPRLIEVDPKSHVLVIEDLGEASDYTRAYRGERLDAGVVASLAAWLGALHRIEFAEKTRSSLTNLPMRRLNHEHVFRFPLAADNGLDLDAITPGLRTVADEFAADVDYKREVASLGERYLGSGSSLLHGDFFPGSWLETPAGPAVIDPEFAFFGPPEFDVGVMLAHLLLAGQDEGTRTAAANAYEAPADFDWPLAMRFCGVEIMRRLIGVAQLPLAWDLQTRASLLDLSRRLVLATDPLKLDALSSPDPPSGGRTRDGAVAGAARTRATRR